MNGHVYTPEENEWLRENYMNMRLKDAWEEFCKRFGYNGKMKALHNHCLRLGLVRDAVVDKCNFTKEENEWLRENWPKAEYGLATYIRYCSMFGCVRNFISVRAHCEKKGWKKPAEYQHFVCGNTMWTRRGEYVRDTSGLKKNRKYQAREKFGVLGRDDVYVTDLGDGEYIVVSKYVYNWLVSQGALGLGEVTKAFIDIGEVKEEMKKYGDRK